MLGLSYDQIRTQINHIESHSDYKQLVEYIDYKVNSSYSDPINTELDFALIKLIRGIKNELKYEKTINPIENANESINTVATNSCNITLSE